MRLFWDSDPIEIMHREFVRFCFRHFANPDGRERAVFQNCQMRKKVEALKNHADIAANCIKSCKVIRQLDPIDNNPTRLMTFEAIYAADCRRFAGTGRTADHHALSLSNSQTNVAQNLCGTVPFIDVFHDDCGCHISTDGRCDFVNGSMS